MCWMKWAIPVILLAFSFPASAQFYKYTDEDGVVRFTDDLGKIPKDQREDIPAYWESRESETEAAAESGDDAEASRSYLSDTDEATEEELAQESKRLETMRNELQQEYEALVQEQERIRPDGAVTKSKAKAREYNRQKAALRERADQYDANRKAYEAAVQIYNEKVRAMHEAALAPEEE